MTWTIHSPHGEPELLWGDTTGQAYILVDIAAFQPDLTAAYTELVDAVRDTDRLATLGYGLRDMHCDCGDGTCHECGVSWPCPTFRLVDQLAPEEAPAPPPTEETVISSDAARFREHSVMLNSVCWRLAEALGDVAESQDSVEGDIDDLVDRAVSAIHKVAALDQLAPEGDG